MNTILDNKTALVTGAAGGIGRSIALTLAKNGARVLVSDVSDSGQDVADELQGTFLQADLSSMEETKNLGLRAVELFGGVDILVNNAGLQHVAPVDEFQEEIWTRLIQVMLIAPFQLTKYIIAGMKKRKWGRIINMSSIHGVVASPYKSAYVSAKHGLIGLTKTVALESGMYGVTVNAICPGYTRTPLVEDQIEAQAQVHGINKKKVLDDIMLQPAAIKSLIEPEDVASLAIFLSSEAARSITGSIYSIDGGWTAR